ncbi:MAG: DMT family transporter [Vicinamibacterales bacterium]
MFTGVVLALCSALVWGTGDFCGGRASTKLDAYQVLGLSAVSGIVMLILLALATGESLTVDRQLFPAIAAGISTSLGIACLYRGLSVGSAAVVAPTAGVVAALLPVVYSAVADGMPGAPRLAGFGLALIGIYLVARAAPDASRGRAGLRLGVLAGLGFGGFLVLIGQGPQGAVFVPLAVSRVVMLLVSIALMAWRGLAFPTPVASPIGTLAGVLDAGGTAFYVLAQQFVRLDVAAVLSSFYPAATVVLSRVVGHERVTGTQWIGAVLCVLAIALIAV